MTTGKKEGAAGQPLESHVVHHPHVENTTKDCVDMRVLDNAFENSDTLDVNMRDDQLLAGNFG